MSSSFKDLDLPIEQVSADIIREEFNSRQYFEKAQSGEFVVEVDGSPHCKRPPKDHPICTHSQILRYYTKDGTPRAIVHQYQLPDGSIGGSGRPDPKYIVLEDKALQRID